MKTKTFIVLCLMAGIFSAARAQDAIKKSDSIHSSREKIADSTHLSQKKRRGNADKMPVMNTHTSDRMQKKVESTDPMPVKPYPDTTIKNR